MEHGGAGSNMASLSGMNRRGVFFSGDALMALVIILIVLLLSFPQTTRVKQDSDVNSDILSSLSTLKVYEVDNAYVQSLILTGVINNTNKSLLEQIGEFYVLNVTQAKALAGNVLSDLETNENVGLWYGSTLIYAKNKTPIEDATEIDVDKQFISGLQAGESVTGFSARAFLASSLRNKYVYFGGYVGDGNLSFPVNYEGVLTRAAMELVINNDFKLYVNDVLEGEYSGSADEFTPVFYNVSIASFNSGENVIEFKGENLHIAGGFFRITYDEDVQFGSTSETKYYFPGIDGLVNLYDGFYIPGQLSEMNLFLHLNSSVVNTFLVLGNVVVYNGTTSDEERINISNSALDLVLDYSALSNKTTPLRLGLENVSYTGLDLDLDLFSVTDISGSMSGQKMTDAKAANILVIDSILNYSGNRVGLVGYETSAKTSDYHALSNNSNSLKNIVNNVWDASGATCICCGMNKAVNGFLEDDSVRMVSYYNFDNNVDDQTGNGHNGVINGNPIYVSGRAASGLDFDGTDDYVNVLDDDELDMTNEITLSAWTKWENAPSASYPAIISKGAGTQNNYRLGTWGTTREVYFTYYNNGWQNLRSGLFIRNNDWSFVSATLDGTSVTFYVDGQTAVKTYPWYVMFFWPLLPNTASFKIGWSGNQQGERFNGVIDEVRVYNKVLTPGEIQALASQTSACGNALIEPGELCEEQKSCFVVGGAGVQNCNAQCSGYDSCANIQQKFRSMVVMSDGEANVQCSEQGTGNAKQDAIQAACDAHELYDITVDAVGFGSDADEITLQAIASCGGGSYYFANVGELVELYREIIENILAQYSEQTLNVTGNLYTKLYPDSYIRFVHSTQSTPFGLRATSEKKFSDEYSGSFFVPNNTAVLETRIASYSGPRWTDKVVLNGQNIYNLPDYGSVYINLGDPFILSAPTSLVSAGAFNYVNVTTGTSPLNSSAGSAFNKIIYTVLKNASAFSPIVASANGCFWNLEFEDGSVLNVNIPSGYTGSDLCYYNSISQRIANENDAMQIAVFDLLAQLDFDGDGLLDVLFSAQDLQISTDQVTGIPFPWSTEVQARIWRP